MTQLQRYKYTQVVTRAAMEDAMIPIVTLIAESMTHRAINDGVHLPSMKWVARPAQFRDNGMVPDLYDCAFDVCNAIIIEMTALNA
jgi:hypothetical protein